MWRRSINLARGYKASTAASTHLVKRPDDEGKVFLTLVLIGKVSEQFCWAAVSLMLLTAVLSRQVIGLAWVASPGRLQLQLSRQMIVIISRLREQFGGLARDSW